MPGYSSSSTARDRYDPVLSDARLRGLAKLSEARKLIERATGAVASLQSPAEEAAAAEQEAADRVDATPATAIVPEAARVPVTPIVRPPALQPLPPLSGQGVVQRPQGNPNIKDPIVVIIRHGKTEYNKCVRMWMDDWTVCG